MERRRNHNAPFERLIMFDNIKNFGNLMKVAGQAREKAAELQERLAEIRVTGESGGGAVRVTVNGQGKAQNVELDAPLLAGLAGDDKEMVEDLIAAAINDATDKVQERVMEETRKLTGGLDLPGMDQLIGGDSGGR